MQGKTELAQATAAPPPPLEPFVEQWAVLLTTYKRDGTPMRTPVNIAVDGDRAFVRIFDTAWKLKRIRNRSEVEVAPSTWRGRPTGPAIRACARVLEAEESAYAGQLLARKHLILHHFAVPSVHRLWGNVTIHIELRPLDG
jgi:PPOX class probable F420-dependent enzyme